MIADGVLTLQGQRHEVKKDKGETYHQREVSYGSFTRRFSLPDDVDLKNIKATFKDGNLIVRVVKSEESKSETRTIKVNS